MRLLILILASALIGCSTTAKLYPIEGPLSTATPVQPMTAWVFGIMGNSGDIELNWPDQTKCRGQWSSAAGTVASVTTAPLLAAYGPVTTVGTAGGQSPGRAFMLCDDGNTIDVEFVTGSGTSNGFGFAKDKRGNVFRVLF